MQRKGRRSEIGGQRSENPVIEMRERADRLLDLIRLQTGQLDMLRAEAETEVAKIQDTYGFQVANRVAAIEGMEKELRALMREGERAVFDGADRVDLVNGSLVYLMERVVVKAKGMLKRLKNLKKDDAIKIVESVKWDILEGWTDEQLAEVGTRREPRESYTYEVKGETPEVVGAHGRAPVQEPEVKG